jgi:VanZ family protein
MIAVMGAIFFVSHHPGNTLHLPAFPGADKWCHGGIYAMLALSCLWFWGVDGQRSAGIAALLSVSFCCLYGISDELHQIYVPYRSAEGLDLLADTAGAMFVGGAWIRSQWFRAKLQAQYSRLVRGLS